MQQKYIGFARRCELVCGLHDADNKNHLIIIFLLYFELINGAKFWVFFFLSPSQRDNKRILNKYSY